MKCCVKHIKCKVKIQRGTTRDDDPLNETELKKCKKEIEK